MATAEEWRVYTEDEWNGKPSGNALHAMECQRTPLEAEAILGLVWDNIVYFGDHYYERLTRPVEMRVEEYLASRGAA